MIPMARQMKDSGVDWMGEIPCAWDTQKMKFLFAIKKRIAGKEGYTVLSITQKGIVPKNLDSNEGQMAQNYSNYQLVHVGDFAMNHMDLLTGWVDISPYEGVTSPDYRVFVANNQDLVNPRFYLYLFQNCYANRIFYGMGQGVSGLGRWRLPAEQFLNFRIPYPSANEQLNISSILDTKCAEIDKVVEQTRATIEEYKKLKQAIITEAVTKGVRGPRRMKPSGVEWIGDIPEDWDVDRLKSLFNFGKGLAITKENLTEKGIAVINYGQIHSKRNTGTGIQEELFTFVNPSYLATSAQALVKNGDFIFADTSEDLDGCGNCVYVDKHIPLFAGYHTIILISKFERSNKYLSYLFKSDYWRRQIRNRVSGVKLFSISRKILNMATCIVPPESEQTNIVSYLDTKCAEIDRIIEKKEQLIEELGSYKKSLIYEYVTGKKEVTA